MRVGQLLADDQHGALEAGAPGVMKPVIDEGFAGRADGFELFGAAEARAHASRHYDDSQRHAEILPNWNDGSAGRGRSGACYRLWKTISQGVMAANRYRPVSAPRTV